MKQPKSILTIYHDLDEPASYTGLNNLWRTTGKPVEEIRNILAQDPVYSKYRHRLKRYPRLKTTPVGLHFDYQTDLADMTSLAKTNKGYKWMLVAIDVLSRQVSAVPVRSKSTAHMQEAFRLLLKKLPITPNTIFSDNGLEARFFL